MARFRLDSVASVKYSNSPFDLDIHHFFLRRWLSGIFTQQCKPHRNTCFVGMHSGMLTGTAACCWRLPGSRGIVLVLVQLYLYGAR